MDTADKILAALIAGIVCLILVSGAVIYVIWTEKDGAIEEVKMAAGTAESENELLLCDDTSIVNNTRGRLWLRAEIIYSDELDAEKCSISSDAVEDGAWIYSDGWYYYNDVLDFTHKTRPLVDKVIYDGESMTESTDKAFRPQVEAVKEDWLYEEPSSCVEAFEMFYKIKGQGETENL